MLLLLTFNFTKMSNQITITVEQWAFMSLAIMAFICAFILIAMFLKENKKKYAIEPYIRLVNKQTGFYLNFNLNEVNEMRKFNYQNKPIRCHVIPAKGNTILFQGFLLESFIDHIQGGHAPETFDVSAHEKLYNAERKQTFQC